MTTGGSKILDKIPWIEGGNGEAGNGSVTAAALQYLREVEDDFEETFSGDPPLNSHLQIVKDETDFTATAIKAALQGPSGSGSAAVNWIRVIVRASFRNLLHWGKTTHTTEDLLSTYCYLIRKTFGLPHIPEDAEQIMAVLESSKTTDSVVVEDLTILRLEGESTVRLRELLSLILRFVELVFKILQITDEEFGKIGRLALGSPEHRLWCATVFRLTKLAYNLHVLSKCFGKIHVPETEASLIGSLLQVGLTATELNLDKGFSSSIFSTQLSLMMEFVINCCQNLIRLSTVVCFHETCCAKNPEQSAVLKKMVRDFNIVVKEGYESIQSLLGIFEESGEIAEYDQQKKQKKRPSFSLAGKMKFNLASMMAWSKRFTEGLEKSNSIATDMIAAEEDGNDELYAILLNQLGDLHVQTQEHAEELKEFIMISSTLMARKMQAIDSKADASTTAVSVKVQPEISEGPSSKEYQVLEKTEFESHQDGADEEKDDEFTDQVFIGMFPAEEEVMSSEVQEDGFVYDERIRNTAMKGVLVQLKTALIPVEERMREREKVAHKTMLGNVERLIEGNEDSTEAESSSPEANIINSAAVTSRSFLEGSLNSGKIQGGKADESSEEEFVSCSQDFGSDLAKSFMAQRKMFDVSRTQHEDTFESYITAESEQE